MLEEWRQIKEYEGRYEISNLGRVKSLPRSVKRRGKTIRTLREKILTPQLHYRGYLKIDLNREGKYERFYIHRLVAMHFLPFPIDCDVVNHIDCNKQNNYVSNLEWMTFKENTQYYYDVKKGKKIKPETEEEKQEFDKMREEILNAF